VRYTVDGKAMDTTGFMATNHVAGLLVIRDGRIMVERYRLGLTAQGHWNSFPWPNPSPPRWSARR
jgi:hypothetical protein